MRIHSMLFPLLTLLVTFQVVVAAPQDSLAFARTPDNVRSLTVDHMAYTVSWNSDYNVPNWVGYCLTRQEAEAKVVVRDNKFRPDPDVADSPTSDDYKNSGYDRGHIAPAADMRWDSTAMRECFYMTNICPQTHRLNAGIWNVYEDKVRELALKYDSLYVCAGPVIDSLDKDVAYIGIKHKVLVPKQFFKALLVRVDLRWHAIVFLFSAENDVHAECVDSFEEMTGLDLFYNLPQDVGREVESSLDKDFWK